MSPEIPALGGSSQAQPGRDPTPTVLVVDDVRAAAMGDEPPPEEGAW